MLLNTRTFAIGLLLASAAFSKLPENAVEKTSVEGVVEFKKDACLVVDAQCVTVTDQTKWNGDEVSTISDIPLGDNVKAKGYRMNDGTICADKIKVEENKKGLLEDIVIGIGDEIEAEWLKKGYVSEPEKDSGEINVGKILSSGKDFDRVNRIFKSIIPSYLKQRDFHIYVVENEDWNAFTLANGSIFVQKGLIDALDDNELAFTLGHELAHYSYKHIYSEYKLQSAAEIAKLGLEKVKDKITDSEKARYVMALLTDATASVLNNQFDQRQENQADRVGLRYAFEAGYDVSEIPGLWKKFMDKYTDSNAAYNFFMGDHPTFKKRIKEVDEEVLYNYRK